MSGNEADWIGSDPLTWAGPRPEEKYNGSLSHQLESIL